MRAMLKCPRCGELVSDDREVCAACGQPVPDPARPLERRIRALIIAAFVGGALLLLFGVVRDWLVRR